MALIDSYLKNKAIIKTITDTMVRTKPIFLDIEPVKRAKPRTIQLEDSNIWQFLVARTMPMAIASIPFNIRRLSALLNTFLSRFSAFRNGLPIP